MDTPVSFIQLLTQGAALSPCRRQAFTATQHGCGRQRFANREGFTRIQCYSDNLNCPNSLNFPEQPLSQIVTSHRIARSGQETRRRIGYGKVVGFDASATYRPRFRVLTSADEPSQTNIRTGRPCLQGRPDFFASFLRE
jgi:hypothetical protein